MNSTTGGSQITIINMHRKLNRTHTHTHTKGLKVKRQKKKKIYRLRIASLATFEDLKWIEDPVLEELKKRRHDKGCFVLGRGKKRCALQHLVVDFI